MEILSYAIFGFVSWKLLMQIFNYSTYHKYFKYAFPVLVIYTIFNAYLMYYFELHAFFLWHIPIFIGLFFRQYKKDDKIGDMMLSNLTPKDDIPEDSLKLSLERTQKYYLISAFSYISIFTIAYLFFYN